MSHSDSSISLCQFIMDQHMKKTYDEFGDEYPRKDETFIAVVGTGIAGSSMVSYIAENLWLEAMVSVVCESSEQNNVNSQEENTYLYDAIDNMSMLFVVGDLGDAASTTTILNATKNVKQHAHWTIGVFTFPTTFANDGEVEIINATLVRLRETLSTVIVIPHGALERFANIYMDHGTSLQRANVVCFWAVRALCEGLMRGRIFLEPLDMSEYPIALFGMGISSEPQDEIQVTQEAISCPLLCSLLNSADRVFLQFRCGKEYLNALDAFSDVVGMMRPFENDPEHLLFQLTTVEDVSELAISLVALFKNVPTITMDGKIIFPEKGNL